MKVARLEVDTKGGEMRTIVGEGSEALDYHTGGVLARCLVQTKDGQV